MRVNVLMDFLTGIESIADRHVDVQQNYVEVARVILLLNFLEGNIAIVCCLHFEVTFELQI